MDKEKMKKASKNGVENLGSKSRGFFGEFKEFALKGNVMDLAVGVIIGGAFQAIVNSVVNDLINPLISCLIKTDFSNLYLPLSEAAKKAFDANEPLAAVKDKGLAVFAYGNFITAVINFFIMALIIFFIVKLINKAKDIGNKKQEVIEEATTKKCPYCCSEIDINAVVCPHCTSKLEK